MRRNWQLEGFKQKDDMFKGEGWLLAEENLEHDAPMQEVAEQDSSLLSVDDVLDAIGGFGRFVYLQVQDL